MAGPEHRFSVRGTLPNGKGKLSDRSAEIFRMFSAGMSEESLLENQPKISRIDIMQAAREALILNQAAQTRDQKVQKILRNYPRAYDKWTPDEEQRVAELYNSGRTMREIAASVQRQPNAIKNRLERLGLFH